MPTSLKIPPAAPDPLTLINHIRQCSTAEVQIKLERIQRLYPDQYLILADFFLSCDPTAHNTQFNLKQNDRLNPQNHLPSP